MDGWMDDAWTDGRTDDGWTDGWMNGWMDVQMDGWMNRYMDGWILVQHPNPQHIFYSQPGSDRLPEGGNITVNILKKKKTTAQRSRMGEQRETVEGKGGEERRGVQRRKEKKGNTGTLVVHWRQYKIVIVVKLN